MLGLNTDRTMAIVGGLLIAAGLVQAAPHVMLSASLGLALCGADAGVSQIAHVVFNSFEHCWGCGVAMMGAAVLAVSALPGAAKSNAVQTA